VAVIAEGLAEKLQEQELQDGQLAEVSFSSYGKLRLADVPLGLLLRRALADRQSVYAQEHAERPGGEETDKVAFVDVTIGYELRCAPPIPYDAEYCQELGWGAVRYLLRRGEESYADQGAMISVQAGEVVPIPFTEILDAETKRCAVRYVNMNLDAYRAARASMIRLEREDIEDGARLGTLAAAAGRPPEEFRKRYAHVVDL
jgi:6-phosphofructokinase 1